MSFKGPHGMAFARIAVPDVDAAAEFYDYFVGLQPEPGDDRTYLRAGTEHHSIELVSEPSLEEAEVRAIGWTVESDEVLAELRGRVEGAGHAVHDLDKSLLRFVNDGFGVDDPDGRRLELFTGFAEYAEPPFRLYRPQEVVHPFLATPQFEELCTFYTDVLGFRASDHIRGSTSFFRSEDRYHHSLAIRNDDKVSVEHICFIMQSLDHVMRGRARALYKKVPIASDMVNHSASRSIAFYMYDPRFGPRIELCDGHLRFSEEQHENHRPRWMSVDPRNIDVWRPAADDWERF